MRIVGWWWLLCLVQEWMDLLLVHHLYCHQHHSLISTFYYSIHLQLYRFHHPVLVLDLLIISSSYDL